MLPEGAQIVLVAVAVAVALAAAVVVVVLFGFLFIVVKCRQGGDSLRLLLLHLHVVVIVIRCEPLNALQTLPHVAMRSRHFRCLSTSCALECLCVQQCLHLVAALAPLAFQRLYANCSAVSCCCHLCLCLCLRRCSHSNQSKVLVVLGLPAVTTRSCSPLPDVARPSLPALPVVRNNFHINVNSNSGR